MTGSGLGYGSSFSNNKLIVIDALGPADKNTAGHLEQDVALMAVNAGRAGFTQYHKVRSAHELAELLHEIAQHCLGGLRPIVHIESHGDEKHGLEIGTSKVLMDWRALHDAFVLINENARGNLGIVMSACHGFHAIRPLNIRQPAPYYFLLGPETKVTAGLLESELPKFYRTILDKGDLTTAAESIDNRLRLFMSDRFFIVAFAKYLKTACIGKKGSARMERLVGEAIASGIEPTGENLRSIRGSIKAKLRAQDEAFHRIGSRFLHGRVPVSYTEVLDFVRSGIQGAR